MSTTGRRPARIDLTVGREGLERGLRDARRGLRSFAKDAGKLVGGGARKLGGGVLAGVGALAGVAGGLGLESILTDVVDFERAMTRLQIATDQTPEQMAAFRTSLNGVSRSSGIARDKLLAGASAYVALTGDAAGAAQSVALFAKVSNATGSSMEDIAATAASMKDNLGIDPKDFEAGFSALAVQGKAGAVELRELASQLAGIAPSFAQFDGGQGAEGLAVMGGALQVIRKGFGSSSEAATGMRALMVSINRSADKFQKAGVKIYDKDPKTGKKRLKDFRDIVDGIAGSKLAKDPTLLTKAFGSDEAKRAFDQLVLNRGLLDELIQKSSDKNAIDRDATTYQQSAAGRLDAAWNRIKLQVAEAFTPERISAFITALEHVLELVNKLAEGLGWVGDKLSAAGNAMTAPMREGQIRQENSARAWELQTGYGGNVVMSAEQAAARVGTENQAVWDALGNRYSADQIAWAKEQARKQSPWGAAGFDPSARHVVGALVGGGAAPGQSRWQGAQPPVVVNVQVDGNTIATATANAPVQRTRPGGV